MNNINPDPMGTPVYLKTPGMKDWPTDKMFYLITADGMFRCRNHLFFKSAVNVDSGPKELDSQNNSLTLTYPKIPQALVEKVVGFFWLVAEKQNSEAAALIVWNKQLNQVELLVPEQKAVNSSPSKWSPNGYPLDVKYEMPVLPPHLVYWGDIHCHVDGGAYASGMDTADETHRAGVHIVVGHIDSKRPQFYCDAVVDGKRFAVQDLETVWEGFDHIDTASVPPEWVERVKLEKEKPHHYSDYSGHAGGYGGTSYLNPIEDVEVSKSDKAIMKEVLSNYVTYDRCPLLATVRQELFHRTQHVSYLGCEAKAKKFIDNWEKIKNGQHEEIIGK